ncbi:hypothetical protein KW830_08290 [Comamonas sp. CMM03]|uniref:hypothetical protein n=1 Tax=Comamonas sp. CMM03 TaxID=2854781 RepID=UPI001C4584BB|nr:hypothetical protein [Comamonas sp. CMM03]MBV7418454.1 hypothetical protein [Comamonas sp. CMM03]
MSTNNIMSIGQFNSHMGYKGRYAYQLAKDGRLVLADDGKHVLVAESIKRIEETRDPSRAAVTERHALGRGYAVGGPGAGEDDEAQDWAQVPPQRPGAGGGAGNYQFQDARAKKEHYAALREEASFRKEAGELIEVGEVTGAFADAAAKVAGVLDALPATVGPMLAGQSQEEVMRVLGEQMDIARAEMAAAINKLAADIEERQKGVAA